MTFQYRFDKEKVLEELAGTGIVSVPEFLTPDIVDRLTSEARAAKFVRLPAKEGEV